MRCYRRTTIALGLALLAWLTIPLPGAIIDDFSTPQGPLSGSVGAVSGPGILGTSREAGGGALFEVISGVGTFSTPVGTDNVMSITYDGTTTLGDNATFAPVDLTDAGIATLFLLAVSGYDAPLGSVVALLASDGNPGAVLAATFQINAPGLYTAPIPAALADFTQIDQVFLALFLGSLPPDAASMSFDFVCTGTLESGCTTAEPNLATPEPGTAGLLALGAAALALFGRRRIHTGLRSRRE
jgi:hypothetical protein